MAENVVTHKGTVAVPGWDEFNALVIRVAALEGYVFEPAVQAPVVEPDGDGDKTE